MFHDPWYVLLFMSIFVYFRVSNGEGDQPLRAASPPLFIVSRLHHTE